MKLDPQLPSFKVELWPGSLEGSNERPCPVVGAPAQFWHSSLVLWETYPTRAASRPVTLPVVEHIRISELKS